MIQSLSEVRDICINFFNNVKGLLDVITNLFSPFEQYSFFFKFKDTLFSLYEVYKIYQCNIIMEVIVQYQISNYYHL